jgi:hypothetical protein
MTLIGIGYNGSQNFVERIDPATGAGTILNSVSFGSDVWASNTLTGWGNDVYIITPYALWNTLWDVDATTGEIKSVTPTAQLEGIQVTCYCVGTRIATERGDRPVEDLVIGDRVLTLDGELRPIKWIGRQTVSLRFADPLRVLPVRIRAGALAENVPCRDLLLSPDHAVLVDDVLLHAGALVNGASIVRETNVSQTFTYYHVELDDHSLILAENTPAETFVDNVDRLGFDNWAEHEALYPDGKPIIEMPYPRAKAFRQVPKRIRLQLEVRATALYEAILEVA